MSSSFVPVDSTEAVAPAEVDLNVPEAIDFSSAPMESPSSSPKATMSKLPSGAKPRSPSVSTGGSAASRVRAAAAMWENKPASPTSTKTTTPSSPSAKKTGRGSPGRATPSSRPTATRANSSGGTGGAGAARISTASAGRQAFSPTLSPKASSPSGAGPPSSFRSVEPKAASKMKPLQLGGRSNTSSSLSSARSATPPPLSPPLSGRSGSALASALSLSPSLEPERRLSPSPEPQSANDDALEAMIESVSLQTPPPRTPSPDFAADPFVAYDPVSSPGTLLPPLPDPEPVITPADPVVEAAVDPVGADAVMVEKLETPEGTPRTSMDDTHVDIPLTPAAPEFAQSSASPSTALSPSVTTKEVPAERAPSPGPTRGMASLFSRVLPTSSSTSTPTSTNVLPPSATPPRDSSKDAMKDEHKAAETKAANVDIPPPIEKDSKITASPNTAAKDTSSGGKGSFFSSATSAFNSFQLPSVSLPSFQTSTHATNTVNLNTRSIEASPTPEHTASLAPPPSPGLGSSPGSTWRSTMSNLLHRNQPAVPATPSRNTAGLSPTPQRHDSAGSGSEHHLLYRNAEPEQLGEGFEAVRSEMEIAAREIRRERADRGDKGVSLTGDETVDWAFWGAVVQDYEDVARSRPKELSRAIQQGVPSVIRGPVWQLMSSSKSADLEELYKALLKQTSPFEKAIQKDISRTLPSHKFFQAAGAGQESLFMVCKAYSLYDQEVGYTQGLAFIVATLLLNMPDEEAFCVLVRLMSSYNLRSHYLDDMPGLQLRLFQFDRLVEEEFPVLHNHFVRKGVKTSMFASQWLMTLFSYRFPLPLVYRVVDIVLAEGIEAVFRFALALLRNSEEDLLKLEMEQISAYLQGDLYENYRGEPDENGDERWRANDFVRDAYEIRLTPLMLDQHESEWNEKCRAQNAHARELDQLRSANRHLSGQVKSLEASLASMNQEHVELVRQLVLAKIAKEDMETELVQYKAMCAQLAQGRGDDVDLPSLASRGSTASLIPQPPSPSRLSAGLSPTFSPHVENAPSLKSAHTADRTSPSSSPHASPGLEPCPMVQ